VRAGKAVDVGVDDHLVIETEDRVVERGLVEPDLHAVDTVQRSGERKGVADARDDGAPAELLLFAALGCLAGAGIAEDSSQRFWWQNCRR
jgi:hypothetical protein